MRNAALPILVIGIAVGCGEAAPNTPAPGPAEAQTAPPSPDLSGTYSDESGLTVITVDRLSESAYALTLSDGRTVICRPRDGLLEGTLDGSPVTARFDETEATVIAFGRRLAYRKVSDEIRPVPLAGGEMSTPPTPSDLTVPAAILTAAEENAPAKAEAPAPVQVAEPDPQVRSSEIEKPRPAEPSTQGPESDAPVLVGIVTVDRESITGELVSESGTQLELADLVTGEPQTFEKARLTSVRRGLSEREAMLRVELPRFLAWKIRRSLPLGTSAGKVAAIDGAIAYVALGEEHGARAGDELIVYRGSGQIVDPDTGAVLGSQQRRIARLTIAETQERFSKARLLGDLEVQLQVGDQVEFAVQKKAIAILPWVDVNGRETTVGKSNAEELTTELVRGRIPVVERALLNKVLAELRLQQTAAFDPTTAQRVGRMLGAKAVLVGTIVPKGKYAEAHLRLIDVETGEILFTASQKLANRPAAKSAPGLSAAAPAAPSGQLRAQGPAGRASVRKLSEISKAHAREMGVWVSPDGLRLYWDRSGEPTSIYFAERKAPGAPFGPERRLVTGRHPTLTADERYLAALGPTPNGLGEVLHFATRSHPDEAFSAPQPIRELAGESNPKMPHLSPDGLELFFVAGSGADRAVWHSRRSSMASEWRPPARVQVQWSASLAWPYLSPDGGVLIATDESETGAGRFVVWSRSGPNAPFAGRRFLSVPGAEVFGRSPFYVPTTRELFFSSTRPRRFSRYLEEQKNSDWDLWVAVVDADPN